jgi:hypothetical protein
MIELTYYCYLTLLGLTSIAFFVREQSGLTTRWLYVIYSLPLVLFTVARPFLLMKDDEGYLAKFRNVSFEAIDSDTLLGREPLWTLVVASFKFLWNDPRTMLILGGIILIVKLTLLYRISTYNKLLVLFMYACMFWTLHDLTQFRVSMAVMFFLLFVWAHHLGRRSSQLIALLGAFTSHAQAFPAFALFKKLRPISPNQFLGYLAAILLLLFLNYYPDLTTLGNLFFSTDDPSYLRESYEVYHLRAESRIYEQLRNVPAILVVAIVVLGLMARELKNDHLHEKVQLAFRSIALGATLAFLFASVSEVQVRFSEFFFVSGLVLAGMIRTSKGAVLCYVLALAYLAKFSITSPIWAPAGWFSSFYW